MTFEAIYAAAVDVVNNIAAGGEALSPDKTVCVICSGTGRIYYGVSHPENVNGAPIEVHAEVDAIRNMQGMGENKIDTLILIDSFNRTAMLPCSNCVGFIMSQNPENAAGCVAMPDKLIPFTEIGMLTGGVPGPGGLAPPPAPAPTKNIHAKGDLLKNRVSSIMQGVDDDDDEEEEQEEKPKKKKFFGLFG